MVGSGNNRLRSRGRPGLPHHLRGRLRRGLGLRLPRAWVLGVQGLGLGALGGDLVQPAGQPLGQPTRVGENQRRAVGLDEVDDALLDVGPNRGDLPRPALVLGGWRGQRGHVLDGDDDPQVPLLLARRLHHRHRTPPGQEPRHLLDRPHGRRQPDPLRRGGQKGVQPLERQGQMGAALGARHRVHLVDDHGLDAAQRLARLRGEQQVQGLGGGDEDVVGVARVPAALVGRGVARADAHGHLGPRQPQPVGRVPDADQR